MNLDNALLNDLIVAESEYLGLPIPKGLNLNTIRARINRQSRLTPTESFGYLTGSEQEQERLDALSLAIASVIRSLFTNN
jgi:hypothetical protein